MQLRFTSPLTQTLALLIGAATLPTLAGRAQNVTTTCADTISPARPTSTQTITFTSSLSPAGACSTPSHGYIFGYGLAQYPFPSVSLPPSANCGSVKVGPLSPGTYTLYGSFLGTYDPSNPNPTPDYSGCNAPNVSFTVTQAGGAAGASLQGQYAFLYQGYLAGANTASAALGSLTADGQGNITGGVLDLINSYGSVVRDAVAGSYTLGADGRGTLTLTGAHSGTQTVSLTTTADQAASTVQSASGTPIGSPLLGAVQMARQTPADFSLAALAGEYVLDLSGGVAAQPPTPVLGTGSFTLNADGSALSTLDQTLGDLVTQGLNYAALAGPTTQPSAATGIFNLVLSPPASVGTGFPVLTFDIVPIDATHLFLLDTTPLALIGPTPYFGVISGSAAR